MTRMQRHVEGGGVEGGATHICWPVAATHTRKIVHCVEKHTSATRLSLMGTRTCGGGAAGAAASRDFWNANSRSSAEREGGGGR